VDLLELSRNDFSQNGEDGIIEAILSIIGEGTRWCCEFGAWDGIHFSNTRRLVNHGWSALLIEADRERFEQLVANNAGNSRVLPLNRMVDTEHNTLDAMFAESAVPELDLLVVDIDGYDYDILAGLKARPRVICVEVNAGHCPAAREQLPQDTAAANVGQPLGAFDQLMGEMGYQLVAYSGNAFFVRADVAKTLPSLSPVDAYESFLAHLGIAERRWLYHVNRGEVPPYHRFGNSSLTRQSLGLGRAYVGLRFRLFRTAERIRRRIG
jgi:hypothetical protein